MKVRAVGYGRSDVGGDLMTGQHMSAAAYAREHSMYLTHFHCDFDGCGIALERQSLRRALGELAGGRARVLIVTDLDRLSRDPEQLFEILNLLVAYGVELHEVSGGLVDIACAITAQL